MTKSFHQKSNSITDRPLAYKNVLKEPLKRVLNSGISPDLSHHLGQVRRDFDVFYERVRERGPLLQNLVELVSIVGRFLGFKLNVWK